MTNWALGGWPTSCEWIGHGWKPPVAEDPLIAELRLLTRDEIGLIENRNREPDWN